MQSLIGIFYAVIIYSLLRKREKITRKRVLFSFYYLLSCFGLVMNYIYGLWHEYPLTNFLYLLTIYFLYMALGIIAVFVAELYFERVKKKKVLLFQTICLVTYAFFLLGIFFFQGGVEINASTSWKPVVSITLFVYSSAFMVISSLVFIFYAYSLYRYFIETNQETIIVRRWFLFVLGIVSTFIFLGITMLNHVLNVEAFRQLWSLIGGILLVSATVLIWIGIGKKFL
ncbi:MAG: hypothetical protein JW891_09840 [Candidatus Lokiarchaeota archaeon]|nr:hypothetical protein [Candidatus Lokiarchaeota archaeon]